VGDDLVAVEIEIDPIGGGTAFGTAEQIAVESARGGDVVNWKCKVKWGHRGHGAVQASSCTAG
jgi:hypothetical protein